jgi:CBS domain-containing protein
MSAHRIGALMVTSASNPDNVVGIVTERDYTSKVGLLTRDPKSVTVKEICTYGETNLVTVQESDSIDECMMKLLDRDIRHLLVRDNNGKIKYLFSVKDLCKCAVDKHEATVDTLKKKLNL